MANNWAKRSAQVFYFPPKFSLQKYFSASGISPRCASHAILLAAVLTLAAPGSLLCEPEPAANDTSHVTADSNGTIAAREGEPLHLATDLGNIVIRTRNAGKMDYHVHLETQKDTSALLKNFHLSARETPQGVFLEGRTASLVSRGRLWVTIEVNIPKDCSLHVSTGGGNIEAEDVNGRVSLSTAGGNITAGDISESARLETDGGHITVKNVGGELIADTGGGHITAGSIGGSATLRTRGGHIRVSSIRGAAHLETGGGNVTLEHSGADLVAETAGGQIEVGEAAGLVHAKTGGGGIRVVRSSGPENLQTLGGSIYLTQVDNSVKASTIAGAITAWFVAAPKLATDSELQSTNGDIVVYMPGNLPVTIDAQIAMGGDHRVIADPAFPLKMSYEDSKGARILHAQGALNGGGEVLRLRAVEGNIRLIVSDAGRQLRLYKQQMDELQQQLQSLLRSLEQPLEANGAASGP